VKQHVRRFFEDDETSVLSPSKNDVIVRKKIKKQKRFLTNSMKYLYQKFCERSEFVISYSAFCNLRPFWVVFKNVGNEKCAYVLNKHKNMRLLASALQRMDVITDSNVDAVIETEMCCSCNRNKDVL